MDNNNDSEKSEFASELEEQHSSLDANQFAEKQDEYRQILTATNQEVFNDPYVWRIGFGRRLGAYFLDNLFVVFFLLIAAVATGLVEEMFAVLPADISQMATDMKQINQFSDWVWHRFTPLSIAVTFIYYSMEVIFAQSLGKIVLGIIIGAADKKPATLPQLLVRFATKQSSTIMTLVVLITSVQFINNIASFFNIVIFIGCFFVLGESKTALHDKIAGTAVYFKDELAQFADGVNLDGKY
ncbi:MAG: RDD family protein [Ignavibacteria bacterium]|jgi:uncharacterized RDD family membrane protein YckC|nr:RDD family protein [Ignavibacteria bacterium]